MKRLVALFTCLLLAGCGGHGFEGSYRIDYKSDNPFVDASISVAESLGGHKLRLAQITDKTIEIDGKAEAWPEVFVREQEGQRFLVFKNGEQEKRLQIRDRNTLISKNGLYTMTLRRVYQ